MLPQSVVIFLGLPEEVKLNAFLLLEISNKGKSFEKLQCSTRISSMNLIIFPPSLQISELFASLVHLVC